MKEVNSYEISVNFYYIICSYSPKKSPPSEPKIQILILIEARGFFNPVVIAWYRRAQSVKRLATGSNPQECCVCRTTSISYQALTSLLWSWYGRVCSRTSLSSGWHPFFIIDNSQIRIPKQDGIPNKVVFRYIQNKTGITPQVWPRPLRYVFVPIHCTSHESWCWNLHSSTVNWPVCGPMYGCSHTESSL
jgi:hypothetical protein